MNTRQGRENFAQPSPRPVKPAPSLNQRGVSDLINSFILGGQLLSSSGSIVIPQQEQQQLAAQEQVSNITPQVQPAADASSFKVETKNDAGDRKWEKGSKITKREKIKRRNSRLSKLLQPKNALMIVNELLQNPTFNVVEYTSVVGVQYKASVFVDGMEHVGFGSNKNAAKNAAAENVLMNTFKSKMTKQKITNFSTDDDIEMKEEDAADDESLPWQQIASFAMYKLFSAWGENPCALRGDANANNEEKKMRPAKNLPENAVNLNPVMLVNQMCPGAQFEELAHDGTPPNCVFNMKCTLEGQTFHGSGMSKKLAKKMAAFEVCTKLLGLNYPPDVLFLPNARNLTD